MAKGLARTFGQDLMRGEHIVGDRPAEKTNGGVLMPSHTSGDPSFYAKKRAKEEELGRELTTEEFLAAHYEASGAPTASGTSIFDPVLCEIAYRWFCPPGGTVIDPFAGGSVRGIVASRLGRRYVGVELRGEPGAVGHRGRSRPCRLRWPRRHLLALERIRAGAQDASWPRIGGNILDQLIACFESKSAMRRWARPIPSSSTRTCGRRRLTPWWETTQFTP